MQTLRVCVRPAGGRSKSNGKSKSELMAIFHCSVKAHSRSRGESATGGAAYRLGLDLTNEQTGERHNYSHRQDIAAAFTLLPENAPAGWDDPARLWNEAEKAEKRKNSCVSREVLVALPAEMTDPQREELARELAGELVNRYRVGLSVGIHRPDDGGNNHHAHMLMTTRRITPEGLGEKTRELDDQKQGPQEVEAIRAMVATRINAALERGGYLDRVDHRTLEEQRQTALDNGDLEKAAQLSRTATKHRGRNREVAARVEVENTAAHEANARSQAQARAGFDAMLKEAERKGLAMAESVDSERAETARRQDKEARQAQEKAQAAQEKAAALEALRTLRLAPTPAQDKAREAREAAKAASEAFQKAGAHLTKLDERKSKAARQHADAMMARGFLARVLDWKTGDMKQAAKAWKKADEARKTFMAEGGAFKLAGKAHSQSQERAERAERQAKREAKERSEAIAQAEQRLAVARALEQETAARHAWENLTPEQQEQAREKRRQEMAARVENDWTPPRPRLPDLNNPRTLDAVAAQQRRHTRKGPSLSR